MPILITRFGKECAAALIGRNRGGHVNMRKHIARLLDAVAIIVAIAVFTPLFIYQPDRSDLYLAAPPLLLHAIGATVAIFVILILRILVTED